LFTVAHAPVSLMWWFWSVGFDGTHIFGTASRTYFDKDAMRRQGPMLLGGLAFFFSLGPAMVLLGWKPWLALMVGTWAYYHVVKQHHGFIVLYKVKNGDLRSQDNRLDWIFLTAMLAAPPILRFLVFQPREIGLPERFSLAGVASQAAWVILGGCAVITAMWIARQIQGWQSRGMLNIPKILLLAAVIPMHWMAFYFLSWQAVVPTVTIGHNLQYHLLIWRHNRNRYGGGDSARHGWLPPAVGRSLLMYAGLGLLFSVAYRVPGAALSRFSDLAFGLFTGFGFTHYWLDSKIWRVRHDPELREVLDLAGPKVKAA
jgi:hypothetical protein